MKNKKGFVFVETIIVVAILITSLLYLYSIKFLCRSRELQENSKKIYFRLRINASMRSNPSSISLMERE